MSRQGVTTRRTTEQHTFLQDLMRTPAMQQAFEACHRERLTKRQLGYFIQKYEDEENDNERLSLSVETTTREEIAELENPVEAYVSQQPKSPETENIGGFLKSHLAIARQYCDEVQKAAEKAEGCLNRIRDSIKE